MSSPLALPRVFEGYARGRGSNANDYCVREKSACFVFVFAIKPLSNGLRLDAGLSIFVTMLCPLPSEGFRTLPANRECARFAFRLGKTYLFGHCGSLQTAVVYFVKLENLYRINVMNLSGTRF